MRKSKEEIKRERQKEAQYARNRKWDKGNLKTVLISFNLNKPEDVEALAILEASENKSATIKQLLLKNKK